jgi:hypothetical protein
MIDTRRLYRIIAGPAADRDDFLSDRERGLPPRRDHPEFWEGVSFWNTFRQARRKALDLPLLGTHVAEVVVEARRVRIDRTLPSSPGHHTVWGDPDYLLSRVTRVTRVSRIH